MWLYRTKPIDTKQLNLESYWGFTYCITHLKSGKKYVGKKNLWTILLKDRQRVIRQSNWKNYWGSSKDLTKLVKKEGKQGFKRDILRFYASEEGLKHGEIKLLNKIQDYSAYFNIV